MNSSSRMALAAILLLAVASPALLATAQAADNDQAQIQALEKRWNDGFIAKDVAAIMSCYVPGNELFVFDVIPPREYQGWDAYKKDWDALYAAFPGPANSTLSEQTVTVVGSLAYGHFIQTAEVTAKDGSKVTLVVRTTRAYRKIKGNWLIVQEHNSIPVDLGTMKPDPLSKM